MTIVLDAGALIAIDRRDRAIGAMLRVIQRDDVPVKTSAAVVAQVWRNGARQANLARFLRGIEVAALDEDTSRRVGELLRSNDSTDLVDAHVALLAGPGSTVLTSDDHDISTLLHTRGVDARVVHV